MMSRTIDEIFQELELLLLIKLRAMQEKDANLVEMINKDVEQLKSEVVGFVSHE